MTLNKKTILVSGSNGFLGKEIVKNLKLSENYQIIAFDLEKRNESIPYYCFEDWKQGKLPLKEVDLIINCAFSRSNIGEKLAQSILFTKEFFTEAVLNNVKGIINMSSQSVYGPPYKPLWKENTPVVANSLYAIAKYSTEIITDIICQVSSGSTYGTNLRLASLVGNDFDIRLTNKFVKNALSGEPIKITGGSQILSYMDIRDAAEGVISLLKINPKKWKKIYNLGVEWTYSLVEIAEIVKTEAKNYTNKDVVIKIEEKDISFNSGIDSSAFYNDTNWKPKYKMENIVKSLFKFYYTAYK